MGNNLNNKTMEDIQQDEIRHTPLNTLRPMNLKNLKLSSPPTKPKNNDSESPAPKTKKIISNNALPVLAQPNLFQLTPIASNSNQIVISPEMIDLAQIFWKKYIQTLSTEMKSEIGWSIYVGMLVSDPQIQELFIATNDTMKKIESTSLKFFDMMGFLIRTIKNENNAKFIHKTLKHLGAAHEALHIKSAHYLVMIREVHQTFQLYFKQQYSEETRFAVDEIYHFAVQSMIGKDLKMPIVLKDVSFLQSLDVCLQSAIGRSMLFRYLQQLWCGGMVMLLHLVCRYKISTDAKTRYSIAKYIAKTCVDSSGNFVVKEVSTECKQKISSELAYYVEQLEMNKIYMMDLNCFDQIERRIHGLIMENHWNAFKKKVDAKFAHVHNESMMYIE